ncbi:MAG: DNA alkylation repair protein [Bacteroidaceae bacterium]|nr:DNA alkylation repair protein [Bacteroidaceae bacterium]
MTIKDKILIIKQRLRLDMNGVASKSMRDGGIGYGLNFGVGLAALKEIAGETEHDSSLAIALWKENVRECKMLASMIYPADEFPIGLADMWVEEIEWPDLAQTCSMYLFSRMPEASVTAFRWIASQSEMVRYCGFLTIAHQMRQGKEMNERYVTELRDQAQTALADGCTLPALAAQTVMDILERNGNDGQN